MVKNAPFNVNETQVRSLGGEDLVAAMVGNPLQYSCLENPMDREAWRGTVQRVAKSQTQLKREHAHVPAETQIKVRLTLPSHVPGLPK